MSTMNSEIYAALIEAGSSEEKATAVAVSVTDYERDINGVKPDLKVIKWGVGLIIAAEVCLVPTHSVATREYFYNLCNNTIYRVPGYLFVSCN